MRLVTCVCVLTLVASCVLTSSMESSEKPVRKAGFTKAKKGVQGPSGELREESRADVLTVFLTGNELGELKPCGCSGGQLGGLDRRPAVFNSVPASKRMIVDTGSFVEGDSEQDQIKFDIIIEAFGLLGYDLVNLAEEDIEMAQNRGLLDSNSISSVFSTISSQRDVDVNVPAKFTKQLSLKKGTVAVTVATFDANAAPIQHIRELFTAEPGMQTANILILNRCAAAVVDSIARMGIVSCLVCPAESDEAGVIGDPNKSPLVVSVGRYGKYVGRLEISAAEAEEKLKFSFSVIPVVEDLRQEASLLELYKDYQELVKEAGLLERQPRYVLPNGLEYTGSASCKSCHEHEDEYKKWSTGAHAHAYATLQKRGSQYDPECVVCHVVGMEYVSGFVSAEKTGHLENVGCENCHGPGSKHIQNPLQEKTAEPKSKCTDCHTSETSGEYLGNEQRYLEKIVHWGEPNAPGNVK